MFSQACVIPSVQGREGVCLGDLHPGGSAWGGVCIQGDTTGYGQRAGGTHPTGMHSCIGGTS